MEELQTPIFNISKSLWDERVSVELDFLLHKHFKYYTSNNALPPLRSFLISLIWSLIAGDDSARGTACATQTQFKTTSINKTPTKRIVFQNQTIIYGTTSTKQTGKKKTGSPPNSAPLFARLSVLDIFKVNSFHIAKFMFFYRSCFSVNYRSHVYRTNIKQFILYQDPKIWNSLPTNVTRSVSLPGFKICVICISKKLKYLKNEARE